jgi:hypothetical protein
MGARLSLATLVQEPLLMPVMAPRPDTTEVAAATRAFVSHLVIHVQAITGKRRGNARVAGEKSRAEQSRAEQSRAEWIRAEQSGL